MRAAAVAVADEADGLGVWLLHVAARGKDKAERQKDGGWRMVEDKRCWPISDVPSLAGSQSGRRGMAAARHAGGGRTKGEENTHRNSYTQREKA